MKLSNKHELKHEWIMTDSEGVLRNFPSPSGFLQGRRKKTNWKPQTGIRCWDEVGHTHVRLLSPTESRSVVKVGAALWLTRRILWGFGSSKFRQSLAHRLGEVASSYHRLHFTHSWTYPHIQYFSCILMRFLSMTFPLNFRSVVLNWWFRDGMGQMDKTDEREAVEKRLIMVDLMQDRMKE